jgi:hypothetical protein
MVVYGDMNGISITYSWFIYPGVNIYKDLENPRFGNPFGK